mmetsp:Transcript_162208/g.311460  ORF Transcript_162208/g.311460 Transcript_162208/m.311460 type:complete len:247 (-) Transcript_162208:809-1549(-)
MISQIRKWISFKICVESNYFLCIHSNISHYCSIPTGKNRLHFLTNPHDSDYITFVNILSNIDSVPNKDSLSDFDQFFTWPQEILWQQVFVSRHHHAFGSIPDYFCQLAMVSSNFSNSTALDNLIVLIHLPSLKSHTKWYLQDFKPGVIHFLPESCCILRMFSLYLRAKFWSANNSFYWHCIRLHFERRAVFDRLSKKILLQNDESFARADGISSTNAKHTFYFAKPWRLHFLDLARRDNGSNDITF